MRRCRLGVDRNENGGAGSSAGRAVAGAAPWTVGVIDRAGRNQASHRIAFSGGPTPSGFGPCWFRVNRAGCRCHRCSEQRKSERNLCHNLHGCGPFENAAKCCSRPNIPASSIVSTGSEEKEGSFFVDEHIIPSVGRRVSVVRNKSSDAKKISLYLNILSNAGGAR